MEYKCEKPQNFVIVSKFDEPRFDSGKVCARKNSCNSLHSHFRHHHLHHWVNKDCPDWRNTNKNGKEKRFVIEGRSKEIVVNNGLLEERNDCFDDDSDFILTESFSFCWRK